MTRLAEVVREVIAAELGPALKEVSSRLDNIEGQVKGINTAMGRMLEQNAARDELLDQHRVTMEHLAEGVSGLNVAVHDYQKSVESTVDIFGKRVHLRLEKLEEKDHGGATEIAETAPK